MKQVFALLNEMVRDGALENYAVAGAIGAMFYVESFSTQDIDVLVMTPADRLVIELPGLDYLKARGYTEFRNEGVVIEDWPVQFLPATTQLEREAYLNAEISNLDEVPVRVVLAEHLVAIMLSVGRPKDLARVEIRSAGKWIARRHVPIVVEHQQRRDLPQEVIVSLARRDEERVALSGRTRQRRQQHLARTLVKGRHWGAGSMQKTAGILKGRCR